MSGQQSRSVAAIPGREAEETEHRAALALRGGRVPDLLPLISFHAPHVVFVVPAGVVMQVLPIQGVGPFYCHGLGATAAGQSFARLVTVGLYRTPAIMLSAGAPRFRAGRLASKTLTLPTGIARQVFVFDKPVLIDPANFLYFWGLHVDGDTLWCGETYGFAIKYSGASLLELPPVWGDGDGDVRIAEDASFRAYAINLLTRTGKRMLS